MWPLKSKASYVVEEDEHDEDDDEDDEEEDGDNGGVGQDHDGHDGRDGHDEIRIHQRGATTSQHHQQQQHEQHQQHQQQQRRRASRTVTGSAVTGGQKNVRQGLGGWGPSPSQSQSQSSSSKGSSNPNRLPPRRRPTRLRSSSSSTTASSLLVLPVVVLPKAITTGIPLKVSCSHCVLVSLMVFWILYQLVATADLFNNNDDNNSSINPGTLSYENAGGDVTYVDMVSSSGSASSSSTKNQQQQWGGGGRIQPQQQQQQHQQPQQQQQEEHPPIPKIHVVVSHCDASIRWTWERYLLPYRFDTMTVITKCGNSLDPAAEPKAAEAEADGNHFFPPGTELVREEPARRRYTTPSGQVVQVVDLPNVGRCDHSYLYWIQQFVASSSSSSSASSSSASSSSPSSSSPSSSYPSIDFTGYDFDLDNDLVLFMKDNDNSYRGGWEDEVPFPKMVSNILGRRWCGGEGGEGGEEGHGDCGSTSSSTSSSPSPSPSTTGFVCAGQISTSPLVYDPSIERSSNMADRVQLGAFQMDEYAGARESDRDNNDIFQSPYRPLHRWVEHLSGRRRRRRRRRTGASDGSGSGSSIDDADDESVDGRSAGLAEPPMRPRPSLNFSLSPLDENRNQIVPVCFGGRFMTTLNQIMNNGNVIDWAPMVESLSRGDNIEEGHFMERMWAALLSKPMPLEEQHGWLRRKVRHFTKHTIVGLISVLPDGAPPLPSLMMNESCINCRHHVPVEDQDKIYLDDSYHADYKASKISPEDDGIDICRMIDHGNTTSNETMTELDRCYTIMEMRECVKNDRYERRFRIQADQCRKVKKIMLKRQELSQMYKERKFRPGKVEV